MTKRKPERPDIQIGDIVLIGTARVSRPADWFTALVIWTGPDELATEHTSSGGVQRQFFDYSCVRGWARNNDAAALLRFRADICAKTRDLSKEVDNASDALRRARDAVWAKLDELSAAVPVRHEVTRP